MSSPSLPEEINQQKMIFQQKLIIADKDLHRLGLLLDNLQIQEHQRDDVSYLSSVGQVRSARIKKAKRGLPSCKRGHRRRCKSPNQMNAEISKIDTDTQIAQKKNQRRIVEGADQARGGDFGSVQAKSGAADGNQRHNCGRGSAVEQVRRSRCDFVGAGHRRKAEADAKPTPHRLSPKVGRRRRRWSAHRRRIKPVVAARAVAALQKLLVFQS